ncbi:MAG: hypothetical protein OXC57_09650, partial [Rhodobacteraceae bacterium]|nr:hypothetical protein [Paracoccaceae bacterium]
STASSKRIVDSIKNWGGVVDDCFHGSLPVLAAAIAAVFQTGPPRTGRRRRPDIDNANYRYRSPVSRDRLQKWGNKYGISKFYLTLRCMVNHRVGGSRLYNGVSHRRSHIHQTSWRLKASL